MNRALLFLGLLAAYFGLLLLIARRTGRSNSNANFFTAGRQSPWYLVAFGMVGTALSGVTFISVPGVVGAGGANQAYSYMQLVLGNVLGYVCITFVLLPLYYRLRLRSIYEFLRERFGQTGQYTGAGFFLLSRSIGAAFRLYLVAIVLDLFIFRALGFPFWATVALSLLLIGLYTFRGGIKTIVFTDTLQTFFLLLAMGLSLGALLYALDLSLWEVPAHVQSKGLGQWFFFEDGWSDTNNFYKQFLAGLFLAIVMVGLDQDLMQKNLTCRSLPEAQKNMLSFAAVFLVVNICFLTLGALLYSYAEQLGLSIPESTDQLYPIIALEHLPLLVSISFLLGLVAATYSSADSALTALTTSFCVDILGFEEAEQEEAEEQRLRRLRQYVHLAFSVVIFGLILLFRSLSDDSVVKQLFTIAGFTYGPLLGLFAYGILLRRPVRGWGIAVICLLAISLSWILSIYDEVWLWGYNFGFELLLVNGALSFLGLWLLGTWQAARAVEPEQ